METQIALVSAQPMPTLILALQRRPRKVVLLTTKEMLWRARWLKEVLSPKGMKTEMVPVDAYNMKDVRERVSEIFTCEEAPALNVTGGTKIMALAAFQEAEIRGLPIFYVDTAFGVIRDLRQNKSVPINGRISIKEYLLAHGFQMVSCKKLKDILPNKISLPILEKMLVKRSRLIGNWNSLFSRKEPEELKRDGVETVTPEIQKIFEDLARVGMGRFKEGRYFCDEETRDYLLGGWFEDFVFHQVDKLKPDDLARSIEVTWETEAPGRTSNEFDILFTRNFRLFYISCKTSLMEGKHGHSKSALYELVALRERIAGLFGKAMLATMRMLRREDYYRAQQMGIEVVQGKDLGNLRSRLSSWINGDKGKDR